MPHDPTDDRTDDSTDDDITRYVRENRDLLSRVLLYGNEEARGFALALIAEGGEARDVDAVQQELETLRENGE